MFSVSRSSFIISTIGLKTSQEKTVFKILIIFREVVYQHKLYYCQLIFRPISSFQDTSDFENQYSDIVVVSHFIFKDKSVSALSLSLLQN